jgi:IS605 OrfB family transposase
LDNLLESEIQSLRETQRIATNVYNDYVNYAFEHQKCSRFDLQKALYYVEREKFPEFHSSLVQSIIVEVMSALKAVKYKFRPHRSENASLTYDVRMFKLRGDQLSLSTTGKRFRTIIQFPDWCKDIIKEGKSKTIQLIWDRKNQRFDARIVFKLPDVEKKDEGKVIGIDQGLVNLAVTSEGEFFGAKKTRRNQRKFLFLRRKLSAKGTRSAKRLLKNLSGKEKRFNRDVNHCIAKKLASRSDVKAYVIEDLKGIRNQKCGKKLNKLLSSWTFCQLESFLTYKCLANGISVQKVSPAYTSQKCSNCGRIHKENRNQGRYVCDKCGFKIHADVNAAINIRDKWVSKSSYGLAHRQGTFDCPNGNNRNVKSQDHHIGNG